MTLLTTDNDRLQIFQAGIKINKNLPKYSSLVDVKLKGEDENMKLSSFPPAHIGIPEGLNFDEIAEGDTHTINVIVKENQLDKITTSELQNFQVPVTRNGIRFMQNGEAWNGVTVVDQKEVAVTGLLTRIKRHFKRKEDKKGEEEDVVSVNVLDFFKYVKGLAGESVNTYKNRVAGYLQALKNAESSGQEALKEKLLSGLIVSKYESVLNAIGCYYVVTEEQVVEFAKKCEKGLSLDYVANFIRPIPQDIIEKINEMNKYEIFDNYVILHYDPDQKAFGKTAQEKEDEKKKDPILFGVINGSNKLYYLADWIDEYCNLTLDEFVSILEINKDDLKMAGKIEL